MSEQDERDRMLLLDQARVLLLNATGLIEYPNMPKEWKKIWLTQAKLWLEAHQLLKEQSSHE